MFQRLRLVAKSAPDDLTILGMGTAGLSTFIHVVDEAIERKAPIKKITLIEKNAIGGPGRPWYPLQNPIFEVNDSNRGMILMPNKTTDFIDWLKDNKDVLKDYFPKKLINDLAEEKYRFAPRAMFGIYCQQRMYEYIEKAKRHGIQVTLATETEIVNAVPDEKEGWYLKAKDGKTFNTNNLVVTTGHISSDKFLELKSQSIPYFSSPWKENIESIEKDKTIVVMGSALTAVDTARRLKSQKHQGKIYFVSPSGTLMRVKGPKTSESYELKYMTSTKLSEPGLTLDKVLRLFEAEFNHAAELHHKKFGGKFERKNIEQILEIANTAGKKNPLKTLEKEMKWSIEDQKVRYWQLMLLELFFGALPYIGRGLNDTDFKVYLEKYFPLYTKWMTAITPNTAKELRELLATGQLEIISGNPTISYDVDGKFHIDVNNKKLVADVIINATGAGHNTELLSLSIPITTDKFGGFKTTDDFQTFINGHVRHDCWAMGAVAGPRNLAGLSIEWNAMCAVKIAKQIVDKAIKQNEHSHQTNLRSKL